MEFDEFGRQVINIRFELPFIDPFFRKLAERKEAQAALANVEPITSIAPNKETAAVENTVNLASLGKIELPKGAEFKIDDNLQPNQPTVKNGSAAAVSAEKALIT